MHQDSFSPPGSNPPQSPLGAIRGGCIATHFQPLGPELPKSLFVKEGFQGDLRDVGIPRLPVRLRRIIPAELLLVETGPVLADAGKRGSRTQLRCIKIPSRPLAPNSLSPSLTKRDSRELSLGDTPLLRPLPPRQP